jgi:hypothetical protein
MVPLCAPVVKYRLAFLAKVYVSRSRYKKQNLPWKTFHTLGRGTQGSKAESEVVKWCE